MSDEKRTIKPELPESDEELSLSLQRMMRSPFASEPTEAVAAAFFSLPDPLSKEEKTSMQAGFVAKLISTLHSAPITQLKQEWPYGWWFETGRRTLRLGRKDIALALGKDEEFVRQVETGERLPWKIEIPDAADMVVLFRVHENVVRKLIASSYVVSETRSALRKGKVLGAVRIKLKDEDEAERRENDLSYARTAPRLGLKITDEIKAWLSALRQELKRRGEIELLKGKK
jgi:hypothetical protein